MNLTHEFQTIRDWAEKRGIYQKGDPKTQSLKLVEEVGELAKAVIEGHLDEAKDAIGDCVVVLTSVAALLGVKIEDCINGAYSEIQYRTGEMENGTFIREK